jgi:hypothetical protein
VVGGKVVYAKEPYAALAPALPPVSPGWSPVARFGGAAPIGRTLGHFRSARREPACAHASRDPFGSAGGCACFFG